MSPYIYDIQCPNCGTTTQDWHPVTIDESFCNSACKDIYEEKVEYENKIDDISDKIDDIFNKINDILKRLDVLENK